MKKEYIDGVCKTKQLFAWLFLGKHLLLSDKYRLRCPRCETKMDKIIKENVTIDVCPHCHGLWLDDGEIDKLSSIAKQAGVTKKQVKKAAKKVTKKKTIQKKQTEKR